MVVSALSAVEGIGRVTVYREVTSTTPGAASWTYTVNFVSIVGDTDEITVWSGKILSRRKGYVRWHAVT